jgi:hypothetical protein
VVASKAVAALVDDAWKLSKQHLGVVGSVATVALVAVVISLIGAAYFSGARANLRMALYRLRYPLWIGYYWVRERLRGGHPGSGKRNRLYPSVAEFESEDSRRCDERQVDLGHGWHAKKRRGTQRVIWIELTGELVAVESGASHGHQRVELLGVFTERAEVDARLVHWEYASLSRTSLSWVRRRAHGWRVPLSPGAYWWKLVEEEPAPRLPTPPPTSVGRTGGAYIGHRAGNIRTVRVAEGPSQRTLYHYVDASPEGFEWGYVGAGPADLARSLLADRLGYPPADAIAAQYCENVVAYLDRGGFAITFADIDGWIDTNAALFAEHPRADPGRYYTNEG